MTTVWKKAKAQPAPVTGDAWLDKLRADVRNPVKVVIAGGALVAFVWWMISFVTG